MKSKKKEFEPLGPGMELIRGGVELESTSDWIFCSCTPAEAYTSGQQGNSGCACGCDDGIGGVAGFNKAYMKQVLIWL
ncbi:MAG: hypothetical protein QG657_717 [Acidobacteriota bacterium]|nr:hypothetical protein [Acidobacteriota bacterium]